MASGSTVRTPLASHLVEEWHPTLNGDLKPEEVSAGSALVVWWKSKDCQHEWDATLLSRKHGGGCPYCVGRRVLVGFNDLASRYPDIAAEWHPENEFSASEVTYGSSKSVRWLGQCGHEWQNAIANRTGAGQGCSVCSRKKVLAGFSDLATTHPELAIEWHPTANGDTSPEQVMAGSRKKVWWLCQHGHEWLMAVSRRKKGDGCQVCSGTLVWEGKDDLATTHPELATQWHPTKNGNLSPTQLKEDHSKKVWWLGPCGHEWKATPSTRARGGYDCTYCGGRGLLVGFNDLATTHPEMASQWHPTLNTGVYPDRVKASMSRNIWWQCKLGHEWKTSIQHRVARSQDCPFCSGTKVLEGVSDLATTHPELASQWHPTKNGDLTPAQVGKGYDEVWWRCADGHEWSSTVYSRIRRGGCPVCRNYYAVAGVNDLATTHPKLAKQWHPTKNGVLTPSDVTAGTGERVWWLCPVDGKEWNTPILKRANRGYGCPQCARSSVVSKGEDAVFAFIQSLGFTDAEQSNRQLLGNKSEVDVYVPSLKIGIEFNGIHYHSDKHKKNASTAHEEKWRRAKERGIHLVQVWEDDWYDRQDLVKRELARVLGAPQGVAVLAEETTAKLASASEARAFFGKNHLRGFASASHHVALVENSGVAVAMMSLRKAKDGDLSIVRYATSVPLPEGFTLLLRFVQDEWESTGVTFVDDHLFSERKLLETSGFISGKVMVAEHEYVRRGIRYPKSAFTVERFRDDPKLKWEEGFSPEELLRLNKVYRIWDAGKTHWVKEP